jgi:GSH-dependent disulfide-bond oxidoreductase
MIDFYSAGTPNGYKVAIMLEECGLDYRLHPVDLAAREQKQPDFLAINPNGRIPAIVDEDFAVFESGAILLYLAEKTGRFLPEDRKARSQAVQWLMWQMAGLGPMIGQLNVFRHYFSETLRAVIARYERESYRLFSVLDGELEKRRFIAGDAYSIADIACWPWVLTHGWARLDIAPYRHLLRWYEEIGAREGVKRGLQSPPLRNPDESFDEQVRAVRGTLA